METSGRLDVLQALRGVAAGLVVFVHAFYTFSEKISKVDFSWMTYDLADFGVKLFFCISGFIIYRSTYGLSSGLSSAVFFAKRRLIRIVPLYWVATWIYALKMSFQGNYSSISDISRSMFFVPYVNDSMLMRPILGAGWTLNFEMLFYLVVCVSILVRPSIRFFLVSAVFSIIFAIGMTGLNEGNYRPGDTALMMMSNSILLFFITGMGVAAGVRRFGVPSLLPRTVVGGFSLMVFIVVIFLFGATIFSVEIIRVDQSKVSILMELVVCALLLVICVKQYQPESEVGIGSVFEKSLRSAGDGSYSTYLVHGFVMGPAARVISAIGFDANPVGFAVAMVLVCTLVGVGVYEYFERPIQKFLNGMWGSVVQKEHSPA